MIKLLIKNIGLLATPVGRAAKAGWEQGDVLKLNDAWILTEDSLIKALGTGEPEAAIAEGAFVIDAGGRLVTPGLVDAHTHLVFGGFRQHELADKLRGKTYLEILAEGGGILSTVRATREASESDLTAKALATLQEMLSFGVTLCEAKSGYGLSMADEMKQLRVVSRLKGVLQPVELVSTFLGAHAVPPEYKDEKEQYIRYLCETVMPEVARQGLAEYCDVFCETGVFTVEESRKILEAGLKYGLKPKIHADEIDALGGAQLAGELGAVSAEHLIAVTEKGIRSMAKGGTIACLLPATSFYLGADYAPARKFIEAGVPVALATDYNPGSCPSLNLQFVMNLGCLKDRMTPEEVLTAVTLNGAAAVGRAETHGSIAAGKHADLLIWNAADLDYICYRFGSNLVDTVIKGGRVCRKTS